MQAGNLRHHLGNKAQVFGAVSEDCLGRVAELFADLLSSGAVSTPGGYVRLLGRLLAEEPGLMEFLAIAPLERSRHVELQGPLGPAPTALEALVRDTLRSWALDGRVAAGVAPDDLADALIATTFGLLVYSTASTHALTVWRWWRCSPAHRRSGVGTTGGRTVLTALEAVEDELEPEVELVAVRSSRGRTPARRSARPGRGTRRRAACRRSPRRTPRRSRRARRAGSPRSARSRTRRRRSPRRHVRPSGPRSRCCAGRRARCRGGAAVPVRGTGGTRSARAPMGAATACVWPTPRRSVIADRHGCCGSGSSMRAKTQSVSASSRASLPSTWW